MAEAEKPTGEQLMEGLVEFMNSGMDTKRANEYKTKPKEAHDPGDILSRWVDVALKDAEKGRDLPPSWYSAQAEREIREWLVAHR